MPCFYVIEIHDVRLDVVLKFDDAAIHIKKRLHKRRNCLGIDSPDFTSSVDSRVPEVLHLRRKSIKSKG